MDFKNMRIKNSFIICTFIIALPFSWASWKIGSVYRMVTILLFVLFLLINHFVIYIKEQDRNMLIIWGMYIGYSVITMFWAVNSEVAITNSLGLVLLGLIVFVFFGIGEKNIDSQLIERCWIVVGVICIIIYMFGEKAAVGEYGSRTSLMIMGTPTDPNEFASIFIIPASLIVFNLFQNKKNVNKILEIIILILMVYCVLMSGSRGALISLVVALLITYFMYGKVDIKTIMISIVVIIVIGIILVQYLLPMIPKDVLARLSIQALMEDGGSGRGSLWADAINKIWNGSVGRMLFGYGQYGLTVGTEGLTQTMHNQLLQQLSNYGIIGLASYIFLIYKVFKSFISRCPQYIGAFIGIMLMSMTITMSVAYKILWILLLMPTVYCKERRKEKSHGFKQ